jgi:hypothetical protein
MIINTAVIVYWPYYLSSYQDRFFEASHTADRLDILHLIAGSTLMKTSTALGL